MGKKSIQLEKGDKFGRLTVVKLDCIKKYHSLNKEYYLCECECGNTKIVLKDSLKSGHTKSCGCLTVDISKKLFTKHGLKNHRLYGTWRNIKDRTGNPKNKYYLCYGGRGVTICDEWKNDFKKFYDWSMQSGYQEKLTIDRIDNDGNYEPSNCKWATQKQQQRNKRSNHIITYKGESKCVADFAVEYNLEQNIVNGRIRKGWSIEDALTIPKLPKGLHKKFFNKNRGE